MLENEPIQDPYSHFWIKAILEANEVPSYVLRFSVCQLLCLHTPFILNNWSTCKAMQLPCFYKIKVINSLNKTNWKLNSSYWCSSACKQWHSAGLFNVSMSCLDVFPHYDGKNLEEKSRWFQNVLHYQTVFWSEKSCFIHSDVQISYYCAIVQTTCWKDLFWQLWLKFVSPGLCWSSLATSIGFANLSWSSWSTSIKNPIYTGDQQYWCFQQQ